MKLLQKIILIVCTLTFPFVTYSQEANVEQNLSDIQNTVNKGTQTLKLDFIPQYHDYSSSIPPQIKAILAKADLKNLQVDYDSQAMVGAISATTTLGTTPAVVRIIIGKSLSSALNFQEKFKQNLQSYQNTLKSIPQYAQKGSDLAQKGSAFISSLGSSKETKQELINEALKKQQETPEKKPADTTGTTQKSSWVSQQLAGYQGGFLFILPKGFKFASISKDLKYLDYIDFEEIILGIGSGFTDPIYDSIPQGFSIVAKVNSNIEPFKTITSFLNKIPGPAKLNINHPFALRGGIMPGIGGSSLGFLLPGQMSFKLNQKKLAETNQLNISVLLLPSPLGQTGVSGVSTGLSGGLKVYLNAVDSKFKDPLDFQVAFAIDTSAEASLTGTMEGLLNLNPIGLPLEFGNVTLTVGINPENIATLALAELGMMGELDFGPTNEETSLKAAIDVKLSGQNTNILVYGDLEPKGSKKNALTLQDIVNLTVSAFKELGGHVGSFKAKMPDLGINKASFYFSPRNTIFANKLWKAGTKVDLNLDIFGTTASLECDIGASGFEANGFMSEVDLGPLRITGAGQTKTCSITDTCLKSCDTTAKQSQVIAINDPHAPKDKSNAFELTSNNVPNALKQWTDYSKLKGPIVNLRFKPPFNIGMLISAEVDVDAGKLGTFKTDACLDVSLKGVNAHFETQVFNLLDTVFTLNAQDFVKPKKWYVCAEIKQNALTIVEEEIKKLTEKAKKAIGPKIEDAQNQVDKARKSYENAFKKAQSRIKSAERNVDSLKNQLDKAKRQCSGHHDSSRKKYPYAKPHQFNADYVRPAYAFIGNLNIYGSTSYQTTLGNTKITLTPNKAHPLIKDVIKTTKTHNEIDLITNNPQINALNRLLKDKQNPLVISSGKSLFLQLDPLNSTLTPIYILMQNTRGIITCYVWRNKPKNSGFKVIFDTRKFAEYMTQTYWYNNLPTELALGFAFGLAINGDNLDITDPTNKKPALNRILNVNILEPQLEMQSELKLLDISLFPKIWEKDLKVPISYADLLFGNLNVIQVLPLNNNDFSMLTNQGMK